MIIPEKFRYSTLQHNNCTLQWRTSNVRTPTKKLYSKQLNILPSVQKNMNSVAQGHLTFEIFI